ncbi:hypothetical protein DS745_00925 [Anaerobacillus alkaliphilus]|uniref:Cell wall elongation regulator TseB-like domain-containing protein n=1 Tax=Anaerobacillus alkaliphilus TaxID=1548597 RepID=A0A4Q0VXT1_9BACI|nr:DUF5590 domain-containing protein [Anaerobacillus alkaliphilus]RXJ03986.1 hypothetical protein DS745_00925 [Anaerobacillus alkaliphilus]
MGKIFGFIGVLVMIFFFWQSYLFFSEAKEPIREANSEAANYVIEHIGVEEFVSVNFYHGSESYQVFEALDVNGEEIYIWVAEALDSHVVKPKSDGISFDDVSLFIKQELTPKKLISIKLGMENTIPLYEITYKDQQNRLSYYFISFKDGTYLKNYHLAK